MTAPREAAGTAPLAAPVRRLLLVASVLVFLAGVQLFLFPLRTDEYFAWTIASPMTAVFLGASYWSAVGIELTAARAGTWAGARIAVPAVLVFTTLTLVITLVHLELFHLDAGVALRTRLVTWGWIGVYSLVPVLMLLAQRSQRAQPAASDAAPTGLPAAVRATLAVLSLTLLATGAALVVAPTWADAAWAWPLTELTGRAIGAWLVGLGVAAAHARWLDDKPSLRPLGITGVLFGALQAIALVRHGDELDWGSVPAWAYVVGLAVVALVSAWSLTPSRAATGPAVTPV